MAEIVWIEDDHERIGSLVRLLEREGHRIHPYGSWKEISEQLDTICASDAIILDIILPPVEEDPYLGLSVLRRLREEYGYDRPVVVCSRIKNPVVLKELNQIGVTEILRKPVRPSVLYATVTKALEGD